VLQVGLIHDGAAGAGGTLLRMPCPPGTTGLCLVPHRLLSEGYSDTASKKICTGESPKQADPGLIFIISVKVCRCSSSLPSLLL